MTALAPARSTAAAAWTPAGRPDRLLVLVLVGLAAVAFVVRLRLLVHGAGIATSDDYDDGVYYAAADALVHGRLPYRDFLLLHPPGITLVLAPFAALGAALGDPVGVTAARLVFIGIGAANTALVGLLASRHSRAAAVVAAGAAAVWFPLAYSERSTFLEPVGTLLTLLAVLAVWRLPGRPGAVVGGVLAGCAMDVKIWYVVPGLLIGLLVARRRRRFLAAAGAAGAAVALPFLLAAPVAMVREVLLDQLGRPRTGGAAATVHRLVTIASDPRTAGLRGAELLAVVVLVLVAVGALGSWTVRWARPFVVLTAVTTLVLLVGPSFFPHYVAFVAPWMLLVLGVGAGVLVSRLPRRRARALAALGLVVALAALNAPAIRAQTARPQPAAALGAIAAGRGCIVSDDPGLLADAGLLSADLAHGCPLRPDVTGWTYDRDRERGPRRVPRPDDPRWQRDLLAYLRSGDLVVVARRGTGLSPASRRIIADLPVVGRAGPLVVHASR